MNQRVQEDEVPKVIFGHSIIRYLHLIHHIRWPQPNTRVLCNRIDVEKAYIRLHTKASVASKCITIWFLDKMWKNQYQKPEDQVAILLTRLLFGSEPAPDEFCITSETVFHLENYLIHCKEWEPFVLPSPFAQELPKPLRLDDDVKFWSSRGGRRQDGSIVQRCIKWIH